MKIWGEIPKVQGVYNKQNNLNRAAVSSEKSSKKDVVSISNNAKDFQTILKVLKDVPDIRQEKVSELSDKYKSGSYSVDGKDVAEKIFGLLNNKKD